MHKITWHHQCYFCQRPIQRGNPTLIFATDRPELIGLCHATCGYGKYKYGQFQTHPPDYLSEEQISFLVQFYPKLYSLPGMDNPNSDLRRCLADIVWNYPASLANPMASLRRYMDEYKHPSYQQLYDGDLETDYLRSLGEIQKAAREMPVGVEVDFRS
ncbi:hypothetical protein ACFLXT_04430 [Chloroflexota bacterium]